jgi:hypothetical protein
MSFIRVNTGTADEMFPQFTLYDKGRRLIREDLHERVVDIDIGVRAGRRRHDGCLGLQQRVPAEPVHGHRVRRSPHCQEELLQSLALRRHVLASKKNARLVSPRITVLGISICSLLRS